MEQISDFIRSLSSPSVRVAAGVTLAITAMVVVASGGCSSGATPGPVASNSASVSPTPTVTPSGATPTPTPTPPPQHFVSMDTTVGATTDPTYGVVSGYGLLGAAPTASPLTTPAPPQVIMVPANETIAFLNFDRTSAHTASLLMPAAGMFPPTFNNNNGASGFTPAGNPISTAQFSTGSIAASLGTPNFSFIYNTGPPGILFFGDFYDYQSNPPFRTVIIVQ